MKTRVKRWISGATIAAVAFGGLVIGATAASAHQGNIHVTKSECVDADTMTATYTIGWQNGTASGKLSTKLGLLNSNSAWNFEKNTSGGEGSTTVTKTYHKSDFSRGNGPWMSFRIVFSDKYTVDGDTRVEGFDWSKCVPTKPADEAGKDVKKTDVCTEPADGTRTYTVTTTTWTQEYVWKNGKWVKGDKKYGEPSSTSSVNDDATCRPDKPKALNGEVVTNNDVCTEPADGTRTYTETTTPWTQEYVWQNGAWELGAKVNGEPTTTTTTNDDATCRPDKPKALNGEVVTNNDVCTEPADGTRTYTETTTPWTQEYVWQNGAWELGAKVNGEPTTTTTTNDDATCSPPPVDLCVWDAESSTAVKVSTQQNELNDDSVVWIDGSECAPPTYEVCATDDNGETWTMATVYETQLTETSRFWDSEAGDNGGCATPQEASLTGTVISPVCDGDVPWLTYDVVLNDPDHQSTNTTGMATITFHSPFATTPDADGNLWPDEVVEVPIGEGRILWPGAARTDNGDGTFTPAGWPGWTQDAVTEEWVAIGNDNFGWTRQEDGVQITIEVNPSINATVTYPPATPTCAAEPPEEITSVLGAPPLPTDVLSAPPATAVVAEATFTG